MTDMQERQSPPALPAVEADTLISGKIIGILKKILYYGFPVAARFKTSIRVGSGAGLASLDGLDGAVVASGVQAAFFFGDRTTPAGGSYGALYSASNVHRLFDNTNGDVYTYTRATAQHHLAGSVTGTSSLRVGAGTGLAALDGQDGMVLADGAAAGFVFRDRTTATSYGNWLATSNVIVLAYQAGNVWIISPTTGIISQDALTALASRGANISGTDAGGVAPSGSRIVKPTGKVYVQLALVATGAIAAGGTICTLATGHAPASGNQAIYLRKNTAASSGVVLTTGVVVTDAALVAGDTVFATFEYFQ